MTNPTTNGPVAPPGWYIDPTVDQPRYWDGRTWTETTPQASSGSPAMSDLVPQAVPNAWPQPSAHIAPDLAGAPLSFGKAIRSGFRHMLTFGGRASRSAYWWFWLFAMLMAVVSVMATGPLVYAIDPSATEAAYTGAALLILIPIWIAQLTLTGRRLHDSGLSAAWLWLLLIPYVGGIAVFVMVLRGPVDPNPYTPST